jgi:protoheme IX farnesyltransferase
MSSPATSSTPPTSGSAERGRATASAHERGSVFARARHFVALTKPGILRLLVLTAICTMLVAARGVPELGVMLWTLLGTVLVCGSANAFNQIWDRDIDAVMRRTQHRPLVQGHVSVNEAMIFACLLGLGGVLVLTFLVDPLAALMGVAGHAYYVLVYTMWLKRRTPQNIVIGGGAGAFPALIGWAAVTGELGATALLIFAVVFLWTPPHFWALALYKDIDTDYTKAGIPMMPSERGPYVTKFQMLIYTILLLGATTLLAVVGMMGIIYLVSSVLLGVGFAYFCIRTAFDDTDRWARRTFAYSILYLALLFGAMSVDSLYTRHFTHSHHLASIEREADELRAERSLEQLRALHNGEEPSPGE